MSPTSTPIVAGLPAIAAVQEPPQERFAFLKTGMSLCQVMTRRPDGKINLKPLCDGWGQCASPNAINRAVVSSAVMSVSEAKRLPDSYLNSYDDILTNMREYLLSRIKYGSSNLATLGVSADLLVLITMCGNIVLDKVEVQPGVFYHLSVVLNTWIDQLPEEVRSTLMGRFTDDHSVRPAIEFFESVGFVTRMKEEIIATADSIFHHSPLYIVIY